MEQVGIAELKARLSEYLRRVQAGEEVVVADRGRPVARIIPAFTRDPLEEEAYLRDLQRRGLLRLPSGPLPPDFWTMERVDDPEGAVRAALEEERAEGR